MVCMVLQVIGQLCSTCVFEGVVRWFIVHACEHGGAALSTIVPRHCYEGCGYKGVT